MPWELHKPADPLDGGCSRIRIAAQTFSCCMNDGSRLNFLFWGFCEVFACRFMLFRTIRPGHVRIVHTENPISLLPQTHRATSNAFIPSTAAAAHSRCRSPAVWLPPGSSGTRCHRW